MDGAGKQRDGQMDGSVDGQMDGRTDGRNDERSDGQKDGRADENRLCPQKVLKPFPQLQQSAPVPKCDPLEAAKSQDYIYSKLMLLVPKNSLCPQNV